MATHTPGPWQAEDVSANAAPNERPWVGRLEENRYAALSCGDTQAEAIANARLIAAPPESHECALLLESLCAWLLHRFGPESPEGQEASLRMPKARAAIARATGASA